MKRFKLWLITKFAMFAAKYIYRPLSLLYRKLFEQKYKTLPQTLPWTEEQVLNFFKLCIWTEDPAYGMLDVISKPEKLYETRKGDCDEFAVFAGAVMKVKHKFMVSVIWYDPDSDKFTKIRGHNILVYWKDGAWYHISNWGKFGPFKTIFKQDKGNPNNKPLIYSLPDSNSIPLVCSLRSPTTLKHILTMEM
jgi:hypothetical protein